MIPARDEEPAITENEEPEADDSDDDSGFIPADESYDKHTEPTIFSYIPEVPETPLSFGFDEPEEPAVSTALDLDDEPSRSVIFFP